VQRTTSKRVVYAATNAVLVSVFRVGCLVSLVCGVKVAAERGIKIAVRACVYIATNRANVCLHIVIIGINNIPKGVHQIVINVPVSCPRGTNTVV